MFDVAGARKAGYSDAEIADYMGSQSKFDVAGARAAKYNDADIIKHLSTVEAKGKRDIWSALPTVVTGAARGAKDVLDTGAEFLSRLGGAAEAERIKKENDAGKREFDARFGDSTGASIGRMGGNIVATMPVGGALAAPLKMAGGLGGTAGTVASRLGAAVESGGLGALPAATTRMGAVGNAAARLAGGAAVGGASAGLVDPDSAVMGAGLGAALPAALKPIQLAGRKVGELARPFTAAGRQGIAEDVFLGAAADPKAVAARLASPGKSIAAPTFAEVADDPGVSALLRHLMVKDPKFAKTYASVKDAQNTQRWKFMYGLGGGDEGVQSLRQMRSEATDTLLALARLNAGEVGTMGVRGAAKRIGESGEMNRRAVRSAVNEAVSPFRLETEEGLKWARKLPFDKAWGARKNIDDMLYGASPTVDSRAAKAAAVQLGELRSRLTSALEKASPDFKAYATEYAKHSKDIDAAKLLNDLTKKAARGVTDSSDNPMLSGPQLAQALKRLTPEEAARLKPEQMDAVHRIVRELERSVRSETAGMSVGSPTAQNLNFKLPAVTNSVLRMTGAPSGGGIISSIADTLTSGAREKTYDVLSQMMLRPELAAKAYRPPAQAVNRPLLTASGAVIPYLPAGVAPALLADR